MAVWADVKGILTQVTVSESELSRVLGTLRGAPRSSMYQSLQELWNKQDANEIINLLLGWGTRQYNFYLISSSIINRTDKRLEQEKMWLPTAPSLPPPQEVEEQQGNDQPFELDPEILAERILQRDPEIVNITTSGGPHEGMNLLHYAVQHDAERLIGTIVNLFMNNKIGNPESLLVTSSDRHDSPMVMVIKQKKLGMLRNILQALPTLQINDSLLSEAIRLKRDDMLFAFVELRSDCVTASLVEYCISSQQTNILMEILRRRIDILFGHGLLHYAVRQGNEGIIKMLLDAYPDLAIEDVGGTSPLHCLRQEDVKVELDDHTRQRRQRIRSLILPSVIRRTNGLLLPDGAGRITPIDQIRKLMADPEGT